MYYFFINNFTILLATQSPKWRAKSKYPMNSFEMRTNGPFVYEISVWHYNTERIKFLTREQGDLAQVTPYLHSAFPFWTMQMPSFSHLKFMQRSLMTEVGLGRLGGVGGLGGLDGLDGLGGLDWFGGLGELGWTCVELRWEMSKEGRGSVWMEISLTLAFGL